MGCDAGGCMVGELNKENKTRDYIKIVIKQTAPTGFSYLVKKGNRIIERGLAATLGQAVIRSTDLSK